MLVGLEMKSGALLLLALGLLLAACDDSGGEEGAPELTLEALGEELNQAYCQWRVRCGQDMDEERCEAQVILGEQLEVWQREAESGALIYDSAKGAECLEALGALSCSSYGSHDFLGRGIMKGCPAVLLGSLEEGASCTSGLSCVSGHCEGCEERVCCEGVCAAGQAVEDAIPGQPCAQGVCSPEAFCDWMDNTCKAKLGEGESCMSHDACLSPNVCLGFDGTLSCSPPPARGEPCEPGTCDDLRDHCDGGLCVARAEIGAPCDGDECMPYATCSEGLCVARPGLGEACSNEGGLMGLCVAGTSCVDGRCEAVTPYGCE